MRFNVLNIAGFALVAMFVFPALCSAQGCNGGGGLSYGGFQFNGYQGPYYYPQGGQFQWGQGGGYPFGGNGNGGYYYGGNGVYAPQYIPAFPSYAPSFSGYGQNDFRFHMQRGGQYGFRPRFEIDVSNRNGVGLGH